MRTRRQFLIQSAAGLGGLALFPVTARAQLPELPHFPARAKRIIFLFQSGGPSQLELFDWKPVLKDRGGQELPPSVRNGQRLTTMSSNQTSFPLIPSRFEFSQHGESGAWVSELMPYTAAIADQLCFVKSMYTEPINHDPAMTMMQTGHALPGRPSFGAWVSYALGGISADLPPFVVLISRNTSVNTPQPLQLRLWGNGFLSSMHAGVQFRSAREPVLFLRDPSGASPASQDRLRTAVASLDRLYAGADDQEIAARAAAYELAHRMQSSVPELTDLAGEPESTFALYGDAARTPGTHAANCVLARRLAERGVRFIQLYHRDWDTHGALPENLPRLARENDRGSAALITDLAQRGLLEDTLVIWGGEFGRTSYGQGGQTGSTYGRDHHPRCFTMWLAGGGIKAGQSYGSTDELGYNVAEKPVHVNDLHATALHLLGIDHTRLVYRYEGRDFRLTDVSGRVVKDLLI